MDAQGGKDIGSASPAGLIDTHCHLDMFDDRDAVIAAAREAGLAAILTIGSDPGSNAVNIEICRRHEKVYAAVGIHPHDAKDFTGETYAQMKAWIDSSPPAPGAARKIVAVGETGLDYHYDRSPRDVQRNVFRRHLDLARETGLPVVVHSREAKEDTLALLADSGIRKGVLHCFSGDRETAEKAMEMGLYLSFAGSLTFRNAGNLREIAREIPDDYLLVETDAPFLTPEPLRGKRNTPSFIVHTARRLAELREVSPEDIARITSLNAQRLFRVGEPAGEGKIAYAIRDSLYLNITNRCTNKCSFCVRFHSDYVKGHHLRLSEEPTADELKKTIGDPSAYREVVFCGYGEPLLRLDVVKTVAVWVKEKGGSVRINTNGHGNLIHRRNILPELEGIVDSLSVSLDAQDEETYNRICAPPFPNAFSGVVSFIREAKKHVPCVQATVVETDGVDVGKCGKIAEELGVRLRVRKLDLVG
ncbi:MAG: TatD family nuclease-associated radical SAM protein [Nitrospirae bacterium]|nr:TatD family nuclease-associated radical SAM protein [Nitrospirota bacterium]